MISLSLSLSLCLSQSSDHHSLLRAPSADARRADERRAAHAYSHLRRRAGAEAVPICCLARFCSASHRPSPSRCGSRFEWQQHGCNGARDKGQRRRHSNTSSELEHNCNLRHSGEFEPRAFRTMSAREHLRGSERPSVAVVSARAHTARSLSPLDPRAQVNRRRRAPSVTDTSDTVSSRSGIPASGADHNHHRGPTVARLWRRLTSAVATTA